MSAEERRAAILKAALPLFARQGFATTTTRQLAEAAGVSEALLYKHFPSKECLYSALRAYGCQGGDPAMEKIHQMQPSTETLVHLVYFLMRSLALGRQQDPIGWETRHRLMLNSCLEDGEYPRHLFKQHFDGCFAKLQASLAAAQSAGDLLPGPVSPRNHCLFAHHLACMLATMYLPTKPVVEYAASREDALHQAVWFALRGIGLSEAALRRYYNPQMLATFFGWEQVVNGQIHRKKNLKRYETQTSTK